MADSTLRIPSRDDIRELFEQLQSDHRPEGEPAISPPPADGHQETPHA
ncbi:MAG: hypothetical protein L0H23_06765 [Luteimonas sp.]|nr:hypothetical protein [Luteimonas sp.]